MNKLKAELWKRANGAKIHSFFAPSRINLIGEHIDYVGGKVFPAAIDIGIKAYACKSKNLEIKSVNFTNEWMIDDDFLVERNYDPQRSFMNFVYGVIAELRPYLKREQGFKLILESTIPIAAGLSSSAAFGVLIIEIITTFYDLKISKKEKAQLFQRVENNYIGVKSGIMDQFVILFGQLNKFVLLDTETLDYKYVSIRSPDYDFFIISSNKKRSLTDSKYNERVNELEQVARILNVPFKSLSLVANKEALEKIASPTLKKRMRHIITENKRVHDVSQNINNMTGLALGAILNQSHKSLADDYDVSCPEIEFIHQRIIQTKGVYGARMIGAGFGGCILVVASKDFKMEKIRFKQAYQNAFGYNFDSFRFQISGGVRQND